MKCHCLSSLYYWPWGCCYSSWCKIVWWPAFMAGWKEDGWYYIAWKTGVGHYRYLKLFNVSCLLFFLLCSINWKNWNGENQSCKSSRGLGRGSFALMSIRSLMQQDRLNVSITSAAWTQMPSWLSCKSTFTGRLNIYCLVLLSMQAIIYQLLCNDDGMPQLACILSKGPSPGLNVAKHKCNA